VSTWSFTSLENSVPSSAMPMAVPTWRKVELMPEAMPSCCGGTTPTAVEASGGFTRPTPTPATIIPGMRWVQVEPALSPRISSKLTPMMIRPGPISSQQRQRHREHDRPAEPLQAAGQLEHQRAGGEAAQRGRAGEHHQPDQVQHAAAVHVREAAGREQERRQGQRVSVDDPLQVREARVQGPLDVRQGDVHDRDVQQQHERAQAHRDQRPSLVPALTTILAAGPGLPGRLPDVWWRGRHDNLPRLKA
jgi:hypothetical protein